MTSERAENADVMLSKIHLVTVVPGLCVFPEPSNVGNPRMADTVNSLLTEILDFPDPHSLQSTSITGHLLWQLVIFAGGLYILSA